MFKAPVRAFLRFMGLNPEIQRVIYAGRSHRRQAFLRHEFATVRVESFPGGDEPDVPDVVGVMHGKINHVLQQFLHQSSEPAIVLAADTRTGVNQISRGKPQNEAIAQETFIMMAKGTPTYTVEAASGLHHTDEQDRKEAKRQCVIELDSHAVSYFATDQGFLVYASTLIRFYSGSAYVSEGLPPIDVTGLSAGLSLPLLVRLGAVRSIDQVSVGHEEFTRVFKRALYTVAVGFAPELWGGEIHETVNGWPWLDKVMEQSIRH